MSRGDIVYIGSLDDPGFDWSCSEGMSSFNVPAKISPVFPFQSLPQKILDDISHNKLEGKKTDWCSWVARVTTKELEQILKEAYHSNRPNDKSIKDQYKQLKSFIKSLDYNKKYALVAATSID